MSDDGSTLIKWPDDERKYRLGIGELRELQNKCEAGPAQIFKALSDQTWRFDHIRETIRLGLIGGGATPQQALAIIGRYVVPGKLMEAAGIAQIILYAALIGDPNDVGKPPAEESTAAKQVSDSTSRPGTEVARQWDGLPDKSMNAHSPNSLPQ